MNLILALFLILWLVTPSFAAASRISTAGQYLEVADSASLDATSGVTTSAWFKRTGGGTFGHLISKWTSYMCVVQDGGGSTKDWKFTVWIGSAGNDLVSTAHNLWADNLWNHVACSYDGTTQKITLNGTVIASQALSGSIDVTTNNLRLGLYEGGGADYEFAGNVAYVQIFNRGLTATEIEQTRWCPGSVPNGMVAYLPLLGNNSPEIDLTGNGNTATNSSTTASSDGPPISYCGGNK